MSNYIGMILNPHNRVVDHTRKHIRIAMMLSLVY